MWETVSRKYVCDRFLCAIYIVSQAYLQLGARAARSTRSKSRFAVMVRENWARGECAKHPAKTPLGHGIPGGTACEAGIAVDCILGDWGIWSTCDMHNMRFRDKRSLDAERMQLMQLTASTLGHNQVRSSSHGQGITQHAENGGQACVGEITQGLECSRKVSTRGQCALS